MTQPNPTPPQLAPELTSLCRDRDCPTCGHPETYTEVDIKDTPPTVLAVGCRKCGWREETAEALSLARLVGLLYQLADNLAAVGPEAPECPVDSAWAEQILAYVPWLEGQEITRADVLRALARPMEHLSPTSVNAVADAVMELVSTYDARRWDPQDTPAAAALTAFRAARVDVTVLWEQDTRAGDGPPGHSYIAPPMLATEAGTHVLVVALPQPPDPAGQDPQETP